MCTNNHTHEHPQPHGHLPSQGTPSCISGQTINFLMLHSCLVHPLGRVKSAHWELHHLQLKY